MATGRGGGMRGGGGGRGGQAKRRAGVANVTTSAADAAAAFCHTNLHCIQVMLTHKPSQNVRLQVQCVLQCIL